MVTWIETIVGILVRWDDVVHIDYECTNADVFYSYLQTKNGCRIDFLDAPEEIFYKDKMYTMDSDIIRSFHKSAIMFLEEFTGNLYSMSDFLDDQEYIEIWMEKYVRDEQITKE